ncbi:MAG: prolyl oligopeptidase family serine peptidase, partial [Limisphaerales bacterium]
LGGAPEEVPETARLASPVFHTDKTDPPLLMIHGDQDPQMPINQSLELAGKYQDTGCAATIHVLHGGAHGGPDFYDRTRMTWVRQFLKTHLP